MTIKESDKMTNFVPYVTFMKHAKKVTKTAGSGRPILKTVSHSDNVVAVTDSHRLYTVTDVYDGEPMLINGDTGLDETDKHGKYPDVSRLIPYREDAKKVIEVPVDAVYNFVRSAEIAVRTNKTNPYIDVIFTEDKDIRFSTQPNCAYDVVYGSKTVDGDKITVDIKYLKELLHLLKDAKVGNVEVQFTSGVKPLVFAVGNFTGLLLPIRTIK